MGVKEKVIRNNQSLLPFFGERLSFIRGLDPLGLQNTSDTTFSMLLPGLNNVTGRIRYYSFYCWLLEEYSKKNGSTNPDDQKQFIRRAEYIIALASQYFEGENGSIPGSLYAKQQVYGEEKKSHNLQEGTFKVDGTTAKTYWNFPLGAFGQYYLGSLRDIGLIANRDNQSKIYVRTNTQHEEHISGEILAAAFEEQLTLQAKELFLSCIQKGQISEDELISLLPDFNLTTIVIDSTEWELFLNLLQQKDYPLRIEEIPVTLRKQTIKQLLVFAATEPNTFSDRFFVYHAYNHKGRIEGEIESCLQGWYFYQFNEFWQYGNTSIFNGALAYLEETKGPQWWPLHTFIQQLTQGILNTLIEWDLYSMTEDKLNDLLKNIKTNEYFLLDKTTKTKGIAKAANGFLLLFMLYLNNQDEIFSLKEYAENNDLIKDGEGTTYFINQFPAKKELSLEEYITEYLYQHIIYRHQYVAFRKIRGGTLSTQKFIIEDHHIRYLSNFDAAYTGPRIGKLIGFLRDLGIISLEKKLTTTGSALLNKLSTTDD